MSWLIGKNAGVRDLQAYSNYGRDHYHELGFPLGAEPMAGYEANVVIDIATGCGDALLAAIDSGCVSSTARLICHDHAEAARELVAGRFSQSVEFFNNDSLLNCGPVTDTDRVLILASHLLNQCDDEESQLSLFSDVRNIVSALARIVRNAQETIFIALEPGWRQRHYTAPYKWTSFLSAEGIASCSSFLRVPNYSREFGIEKSAILMHLRPIESLVEVDPGILDAKTSELDWGFGSVQHPRIEARIFELFDGRSFGERHFFLDDSGVVAVLDARQEREDTVIRENQMNRIMMGWAHDE
jgi:hypothetical protein